MKLSGFIRLPKHRTFNYTPRYYNPEKEELDDVVRKAELGLPQKLHKTRGKMDYYFSQKRVSAKQTRLRRMIVFVTIILLFVVLYYVFDVIYYIF